MTFAVRRIRAGEWQAWRELRNRSLADAPDAFGTTLAESLERDDAWWAGRTRDLAESDSTSMFVAEDADGRWLGCAGGHRDERSVQVISVWTAPEARGRGVGRAVCRTVVEWAREVGEPRVRLWVVDGNAGADVLYRRLGFAPTGRAQELREGLTERELALVVPPPGVAIRPERPGDREAIAEVVTEAFESAAIARLVESIRESRGFVPDLSLVAERDGRVVGHVMVSYAALRDGGDERRVAILSPLAVAPEHQRQGIGAALVRDVTARADATGEPVVVLEGGPAYYGRLGFEHSVPHGIHVDLPSWAPPEAAQVLRLRAYDPSVRGRLVYPPAFDEVTAEESR